MRHSDPTQFATTLQHELGFQVALNEYIQHTGSRYSAVPAGNMPGEHWGEGHFT